MLPHVVGYCFQRRVAMLVSVYFSSQPSLELCMSSWRAFLVSALISIGTKPARRMRPDQTFSGSLRSMRVSPSQAMLLRSIIPPSYSAICRCSASKPLKAVCVESKNAHQNLMTCWNLVKKSGEFWSESFSPTTRHFGSNLKVKSKNASRGESTGRDGLLRDAARAGTSSDSLCKRNWQHTARTWLHRTM